YLLTWTRATLPSARYTYHPVLFPPLNIDWPLLALSTLAASSTFFPRSSFRIDSNHIPSLPYRWAAPKKKLVSPSTTLMAPNDKNEMARLLYAIIKQLNLTKVSFQLLINWDQVARDPVLLQPISNGHAARMRYFRFKETMAKKTARRPPKSKGLEQETSAVVKTEPSQQCPPTPAVSPNLDNTFTQPRADTYAPFVTYQYDALERFPCLPQPPYDDDISQTVSMDVVSLQSPGAVPANLFPSPDMFEPAVTVSDDEVESRASPHQAETSDWSQQYCNFIFSADNLS
ncbi:hypothetical protein L249_2372, partial [Ophiocordyceps polyrhachis-furcata BCC 54312]